MTRLAQLAFAVLAVPVTLAVALLIAAVDVRDWWAGR